MFKRLAALWKRVQAVQVEEQIRSHIAAQTLVEQPEIKALRAQGLAFQAAGDLDEAEECFRAMLEKAPLDAKVCTEVGNFLYFRANRLRTDDGFIPRQAEAQQLLQAAVRLNPELYEAYYNLGYWARTEHVLGEAESYLEHCLLLSPDYEPAMVDLAYAVLGKDGSVVARERIQALQPLRRGEEVRVAWAWILQDCGEDEQALEIYRGVLKNNPECLEAHLHKGVIHLRRLEVSEALASLELFRGVTEHSRGQLLLGYALLSVGRLQDGFRLYEKRFALSSGEYGALPALMRRFCSSRRWNGEPLNGRRLLLWAEQGLGDTLMFCRFLTVVRQRFGLEYLRIAVQPALFRLLQESDLADEVVLIDDVKPDSFDLHYPIMSLPVLLNTRLADLPGCTVPYLTVPAHKVEFWKARLAALPGQKVGLVWAGNPQLVLDALRSIPLQQWRPVLAVDGVSFISLQKGAREARDELAGHLTDWMDECQDMQDTAALICGLDLVIAVDTSVAHLAGALGKPVFLLNRHESEWRWLFGREDSPWYPSLRQFRQSEPKNWAPVMRQVAQALQRWELAFIPDPIAAEALKEEGNQRLAEGDLEQAGRCYEAALRMAPGYPRALSNLGFLRYQQGLIPEAKIWTELALEFEAGLAPACYNLGSWENNAGDLADAVPHLQKCLALDPDHKPAQLALAYSLVHLKRAHEARELLADKLKNAELPELRLVWGRVLDACGEHVQARTLYASMLQDQTTAQSARLHLGVSYLQTLELEQAQEVLKPFVGNPQAFEGILAYSALRLLQGDLREGFALFENRLKPQSPGYEQLIKPLDYFGARPVWQGESLQGKRLLVWAEQGLGDTLMFARFLPWLRRLGVGKILLAVPSVLKELMRASGLADEVLPMAALDPDRFDLNCSLVSLPHLLGVELADLPGTPVPYLTVPAELRTVWASRVEQLPGLRVGLVWAGNPRLVADAIRSIPLVNWAPVLQVPGVSFVSLQKGDGAAQLQTEAYPITDWMNQSKNMLDTAALICALDLVIAVDTGVAHLAAALGKPVFLLNRYGSEWRWMVGREDSPWYPTLRQFRQDRPDDWGPTLVRVAEVLAERAAT